jgi:helicase
MKVGELVQYGIPEEGVEILRGEGIEELYPPQAEAVRKGLLDLERSHVISIPTASGKTLLAELLMLKTLREKGGKCLYLVPLRALASEKLEEFRRYAPLGVRCALSSGDYDASDSWLSEYDWIIATSEKADSLLRHGAPWLRDVATLVVDEIHLLNDADRGPTLEVTIARLRHLNPDLLVLGLSATIQNAGEIASWLGGELVESDWRPVPLREGIYCEGEIFFSDSQTRPVPEIVKDRALNLALDGIREGGQSLVFVGTRSGAERFALNAARAASHLSGGDRGELEEMAREVLAALPEPTRICLRLGECLQKGTAFHHAGLAAKQRRVVEEGFRKNRIKILSATPTLAAGVNLPARRVIIRDYTRYEGQLGRSEIPVLEYKQMCGRAGRPRYDPYGEALLVARSPQERAFLLDAYLLSGPERIHSKLAVESALRSHALATIALGYAASLEELLAFFSRTFFAHQQELYLLEETLHRILEFLLREGLCREEGRILTTPFGKRVSQLYLDPLSGVLLRDGIARSRLQKTVPFSYLHLIASLPEMRGLYLRSKDYDLCTSAAAEYGPYLLSDPPSQLAEPWRYEEFLSQVKTALFLQDWIEERGEEFLLEKYRLGPGDIRTKVERADWLLYSMTEIGRLLGFEKAGEVARLRERVRRGVKEELLELTSLRGIGRVRARKLYARGFRTLEDLRKADPRRIAGVELIGRRLAERIQAQLLGEEVPPVTEEGREEEGREEGEGKRQTRLQEF